MWRLIRKYSFFYVFYLILYAALIFPLMNHDRVTGPRPFDMFFIIFQSNHIFWILMGSIFSQEQIEYKSNSRNFLGVLPISAREIVTSRFTLVLFSAVIFVGFNITAFWALSFPPEYFAFSVSFFTIIGNIGLLLSAVVYIGIFKFGFSKMGKLVLLLWILIYISPLPVKRSLMPKLGLTPDDVVRGVSSLNWVVVTLVCLLIYYGLMRLTIKIKGERPCS